MARPRKSEGRETRREILDAALDLFAVGGYFGTSMRQIARAVGVRESALYHHFAAKEAILEGLLAELGPARAQQDRKSTRLNSSHGMSSRMPSSA